MENINSEDRDFLLWRFFHKDVNQQELNFVERMLTDDKEWKEAYDNLQNEEELLSHIEADAPSMRFSKNIMDNIKDTSIAKSTKSYVNARLIKALGLGMVTIVIALLVYAFTQIKWAASSPTRNIDVPMPKISVNWNFTQHNSWMYVFFSIIMVCTCVVVDKILSKKMNYHHR